MSTEDTTTRIRIDDRPSPADFDAFVPWACTQLELDTTIVVVRSDEVEYTPISSERTKASRKHIKVKEDEIDSDGVMKSQSEHIIMDARHNKMIKIFTIYDNSDHLVKLKFQKVPLIPRALLHILSLIVPFHPRLHQITIGEGLRQGGLYYLSKILSLSKVTEVILDNTLLSEGNYYLLLDKNCSLKYLSLARCKLNDAVVHTLTSRLREAPLAILNLSTNRITDTGAIYLGEALRSNRNLKYLNLSSNLITDEGAISILNSLSEFPLTNDELLEKRFKRLAYLRERNELTMKIAEEMRSGDMQVKVAKKKITKPVTPATSKKYKEADLKPSTVSLSNIENWREKAQATAVSMLGAYEDPFSSDETILRDGVIYCLGNNILCYLNLAYNNLTYFSVQKLYNVLSAQDDKCRTPRGLVNVCIEGNNIPDNCMELTEIEYILQSALAATQKVSSVFRKKTIKSSK